MASETYTRFGRRLALGAAVGLSVAGLWVSSALAAYPERPIKLIVAQDAGTSADLGARQLTAKMTEFLGQSIVVENHGGAGGILGTEVAAHSPPDGYTLDFATAQTHAANLSLYKKLPYDPVKDFTPVAGIDIQNFVLVVNAALPIHSVKELIDYAKKQPGKLNYASTGNGTTAHLSGALFNNLAGVNFVHVPYKSASQAMVEIQGGLVAIMFYPYISLKPMVDAGKLRILATTGQKREPYLPDVPTMIESGVPGFTSSTWHGIYGPAGMPRPIVDTLFKAIDKTLKDPEIVKKMTADGVQPIIQDPDKFAQFTKSEVERYKKVVAISGATLD